jgi:hypothetical protein
MSYKCFLELFRNIRKYSSYVTDFKHKYAYQKFLLTLGSTSTKVLADENEKLEYLSSPFTISSTESWIENMLDAKSFPRERASISEDMLSLLITNYYPDLFFDEKVTSAFLTDFKRTEYYNVLNAEDKSRVCDLFEDLRNEFYVFDGVIINVDSIKTPEEESAINIIQKLNENITSTIKTLEKLNLTNKYDLYRNQLSLFINFSKNKLAEYKNQTLSIVTLQALNEFTKGFLISAQNKNFEQMLIYCQAIGQVVQLVMDHYPPTSSITEELNNACLFKEQPTASFLAANQYSLFVKLLDISTHKTKKLFLLDKNFIEEFRKILGDAYLIEYRGYVADLPKDANVIFTRIESVDFTKCTINILIETLRKNELNFPITVVVDISRVALKDELTNTILTKTKPFRDNGSLNLLLMQAQSHFWQVGLNKGKGNLLAIFNNKAEHWHGVNNSIAKSSIYPQINLSDVAYFLLMNVSRQCSEYTKLLENGLDVTYEKAKQIAQSLHIPKRNIEPNYFGCLLNICLKERIEEAPLSKNLCSLLENDGLKFIWGRVIGNPLLALHVTSVNITISPGLVDPNIDERKIAYALTSSLTSVVNGEIKAKWAEKISERDVNEEHKRAM